MYRQNHQTTPSRIILQDQHGGRPPRAPERPIVPYIRYSRKMWPKIRQENPDSQLWDIGKIVSKKWQDAPEAEKAIYQQEYEIEKVEYEKAMKIYHSSSSYQQYMHTKGRGMKMDKAVPNSRKGMAMQAMDSNTPAVLIQSLDDEDPFEMTGKRLAAIRFDRNNRLMSELFSSNYLPDTRNIIAKNRIETLKTQASNLSNHQNRMNEELVRLDETFKKRKQTIEESSSSFMADLQKIVDEKPEFGEENHNRILLEHQELLLKNYEDYKKREEAIRRQLESLEAERRETPVLYSLTCEKTSPLTQSISNNPLKDETLENKEELNRATNSMEVDETSKNN